jgi:alkanesulfonate monooxygenase
MEPQLVSRHELQVLIPLGAAITGAAGNSAALVGTPDQVAESLMRYVNVGCETLLIRGFLPYDDAVEYGRELIPIIRAEAARRNEAVPA